jgi:hypothetical protein
MTMPRHKSFGYCVTEIERRPTNAQHVDADRGRDFWWAGAGDLVRQNVVG